MQFNDLKNWRRLVLLIAGAGVFIVLAGCDDVDSGLDRLPDSGLNEPTTNTFEYEIGPEGGTIEVQGNYRLDGLKIVIPEGALAEVTKITITCCFDAPDLPDGIQSYNPNLELIADALFLKDIQIFFPRSGPPEFNENMPSAVYWDKNTSSWQVAMAEGFANDLMTVHTQRLGYWQWGKVLLEPLADEMFGLEFMDRLADAFEVEAMKLIDWHNLDYCADRVEIANVLREIRGDANVRVEEHLQSVNAACDIWEYSPKVGDIFYGVNEYIQINGQRFGREIVAMGLGTIPYVGWILEGMAKAQAQAIYEQKLTTLKDEYGCIFAEAESALWINIGIYAAADAAILGMQIAENESPCD